MSRCRQENIQDNNFESNGIDPNTISIGTHSYESKLILGITLNQHKNKKSFISIMQPK